MKILIANNYYYPNMEGGAEFSVQLLAENLVKAGHDVSVLTMDGGENLQISNPDIIHGVKIYRSYSKQIYRRRILKDKRHFSDKILNGLHSIWNLKMNRDVKKALEYIKPDVIHTNNLVSMSYWIWKYAKKQGIPVVHTLRDYWLIDPTTNIGKTPKSVVWLFQAYHKYLSNTFIDFVTSPSDRTLEIFRNYGYFQNCVSQKIVNSISFNEELLTEVRKEKVNRNESKIGFVFAGKVSEYKGIKLLVEAFEKANVNATLSVCGTGDLERWISDRHNKNIILLGKLKQKELFEEYKKADVLIVPSLWEEPFGRIVIEGAQYALPTIGSNKGGVPEIIRELNYGKIFDPDNEKQLIECLKLFSDRDYVREYVVKGPEHLEIYSAKRQIESFVKVYKEIVKVNQ